MAKNKSLRVSKNKEFIKNGPRQLGFLFNNLGLNQKAYLFIKNANKFLETRYDVSICAFVHENRYLPIVPNFAVYHMGYMQHFDGDLVCSDLANVKYLKKTSAVSRSLYLYDIEWVQHESRYPKPFVDSVLHNTEINIFTRTQEYLDILSKEGYNLLPRIVEDFCVEEILATIDKKEQ